MKKIFSILLFLLVIPAYVNADSFSIEDENLLPIPSKVAELIISAEHGEWGGCKFIGKYCDLSGDGYKSDLIVTVIPGDTCGTGNAKGPIWVLRGTNNKFKLLLSTSGYNLIITKTKKNRFYSLDITAGTAGWYEESHWEFNGKKYVEINNPTKTKR